VVDEPVDHRGDLAETLDHYHNLSLRILKWR